MLSSLLLSADLPNTTGSSCSLIIGRCAAGIKSLKPSPWMTQPIAEMMWGSGSFIWRKFVASASCGRGWYWDGPLEDAGADGYTVAIGTTGHSGVAVGGVAVWAVGASSLTRGSSSSSFSIPPSLSSMSTLVSGGTKAHLMKVNSAVAHSMLCGNVATVMDKQSPLIWYLGR